MTTRAVRQFQVGVLVVGAAWRLFLIWPVRHVDSAIVSLAMGMMPYSVLALLAPWIGSRASLVAASALVLGIDLASGVAAMKTASSTGAIAVLLGPIASTLLGLSLLAFSSSRRAGNRGRSPDRTIIG